MLPLHTTTRGLKVKIGVTAISAKAKQNGGVYLSLSHDLTGQKSKFGRSREGGRLGSTRIRLPLPPPRLRLPLSLCFVLFHFHSLLSKWLQTLGRMKTRQHFLISRRRRKRTNGHKLMRSCFKDSNCSFGHISTFAGI